MEKNIIRPNAGSRAFDTNIEEIKKAEATTRELANIQQTFIKKFSAGEIISADELNKLHNILQKLKDLSTTSNDARIHFTKMVGQISETVAIITQNLQDSNHFDNYKDNIIECVNIVKKLSESQLIIHSNSTETNIQLQKLIAIFNQLQQSSANDISLDPNIANNIFEKKEQLSDSFSTLIDTANRAELTNNALQEFYTILQGKLKDNSLLVGKLSKDISETNISINKSSKDLLEASRAFKTDSIPNSFEMLYSGLQDIHIASNKMNLQLTSSGTVDKTIFEQFNEGLKQASEGQTEVQKTIANELDNLNRPFLVHIINSSNNALNAISQAKRVYEDTVNLSDKIHNDLHYDAIRMLRESKEHITNSTNEIINTIQTQTSDNIDNFFKILNEAIHVGKTDLYTESATGYNLGSNYMSATSSANQTAENIILKSMHLQDMSSAFNRRRLKKIEEKTRALAKVQCAIACSKSNAMNQFQQMVNADSPDKKAKFKDRGEKTFSKTVEQQLIANLLAKELGEYIDEIVVNGLIDLGKDGKEILSSIETVLNQNQVATRELMSAATNFHIEIDKDDMQTLKEQYKELEKCAETVHKINVKYTDFTKYFSKARTDTIRSFKNTMNSIGNTLSKLGIHGFSFNILDYILKPFKYIEEQGRERYKTMGIDASIGVMDMATSASDTQQRLMEGNQLYAASGGMIDRGFINDMYKDLMKDVGGHYGGTPEQARSDVNTFVHQTYKIAAANGLDNSTMKDVFQTYYKDMRLSAEDAAGEFAKMMETAKNANVPIKQYMNMMNNLAKTFMKVGIKGTRADEIMQKLLMDGLRVDVAQEVTQEAAGALNKESQDKNWVAYAASVSGMNPFEGLSRAAYSHEADGSERAGWTDDMVQFADTRINTIAGAAGNDPNIMRMLVTDEFKNMGFSQRSASILTSSYMQGNREQFKRLFAEESLAKDDPRAKLDEANKKAEEALTAMSGQLAEIDHINAQLDSAMYEHAAKLAKVIKKLIEQLAPILKRLQQAMLIMASTILKAFKLLIESETFNKIIKLVIENPIKSALAVGGTFVLSRLAKGKFGGKGKWITRIAGIIAGGLVLDDAFADDKTKKSPTALDTLIKGLDDSYEALTDTSLVSPEKDKNGNPIKGTKKLKDPVAKIVSSMGQTLKETMGLRKGNTVEEAIENTPSTGISNMSSVGSSDISSTIGSLGNTSLTSSSPFSETLNEGKSSMTTSTSSMTKTSGSISNQNISTEGVPSQSSKFSSNKPPVAAALKENIQIGEKMQGTPMHATSKETFEEKPNKQKQNKQKKPNTNIQAKGIDGRLINMKNTTLSKDYQDIEMRRLGQLGMNKSAILANIQSTNVIDTEDILVNYPNKVIKGQPSQEKTSTPYANIPNISKYASINDYYKSFFDEEIIPKDIKKKSTSSIKNTVELANKKAKTMSMPKMDKVENKEIKAAKKKEIYRLSQLGIDKFAILANIQSTNTTDTEDILVNYPNKVIKNQSSQEKTSTPYANIPNISKYTSINDYYKSFFDEEIIPKDIKKKSTSSIKNTVELANKKAKTMFMPKMDKVENEETKTVKKKEIHRLSQLGIDKSAILVNIQSTNVIDTEANFSQYNYPQKIIEGQSSQEKAFTPYANIPNISKYASINDYYKSFFDEEMSPKDSIKNIVEYADKKVQTMSMTKMDKIEEEIRETKKKETEVKNDISRQKAANSQASKVVSQNKKIEDLSKIRNEDIIQFMKLNQSLYGNFQASVHIEHGNLWKKLNELEEVLKLINHNWIAYGKRWENVQLSGKIINTGDELDDLAVYASSVAKARGHNIPVEFFRTILRSEAGSNLNSYQSTHWNNPLGMDYSSWHAKFGGRPADEKSAHGHTRTIFPSKEKAMEALVEYFLADDAHSWAKEEIALVEQGKYEDAFRIHYKYYVGNGSAYEGSVYSKIVKEEFSKPVRYGGNNINRMSSGGNFKSSPNVNGDLEGLDSRYLGKWESAPGRTYIQGLQQPVKNAMNYVGEQYYKQTGQKLLITGAAESGHAAGKYGHASGWKVDIGTTTVGGQAVNSALLGQLLDEVGAAAEKEDSGHFDVSFGDTSAGYNRDALYITKNRRGQLATGGSSYQSSSASYHGNYLDNSNLQVQTYDSAQSNMIGANNIGGNYISYVEKLQKEAEEKTKAISNSQLEQLKGLSEEEQIKKLYTMKGPNGKTYSKNDINYLVEQNYKAADIIKELSQSDTYKAKAKLPGEYDPNVFDLYKYGTNDITVQGNQVIVHSLTEQPYSTSPLALFSDNQEVIIADGTRIPGWQANNLLRNMRKNEPFLEVTLRKRIDNDEIIEEGMKSYYRKVELNLNVQNSKEIFQTIVGEKIEQKLNDLQKKYENIGTKFLTNEKDNLVIQAKQVKAAIKKIQK